MTFFFWPIPPSSSSTKALTKGSANPLGRAKNHKSMSSYRGDAASSGPMLTKANSSSNPPWSEGTAVQLDAPPYLFCLSMMVETFCPSKARELATFNVIEGWSDTNRINSAPTYPRAPTKPTLKGACAAGVLRNALPPPGRRGGGGGGGKRSE